jgi:hypothetical protein
LAAVPGHHQHYTVVAAEKVDIPGHFQHIAVRGFLVTHPQRSPPHLGGDPLEKYA